MLPAIRAREARGRRRDGTTFPVELTFNDTRVDRERRDIVVVRDITERKRFDEQLRHQAFHDPLTQLPNRALFMERLTQALRVPVTERGPVSVLFLDLDRFKVINDSLGHSAGDVLLAEASRRIRACIQPADVAARLGGDEFTILLQATDDAHRAIRVAERLLALFEGPISLDGHEVFVTTSIGIGMAAEGVAPGELLRRADVALYRAKQTGKARYAVFSESMQVSPVSSLHLERDLHRALQRGELEIAYQPIFSLRDGRLLELEALLRWQHPEHGSISPAVFIPIAEETGLVVALGQWVLEQAARQARAWQERFLQAGGWMLSVNLSARQFQHRDLAREVARITDLAGLDRRRLKLELTESTIMHDPEAAVTTLETLKDLGIRLAIDDFGTGYSSLSYLKRFPIHTLKIDRSFVSGLGRDDRDEAIVGGVVTLARALGLSVTAEGIETAVQERLLRELGCDAGQGYLFARPLAPRDVAALLATSPVSGLTEAA
jgi:diguanylate cyclase (GGDEF)-like protein